MIQTQFFIQLLCFKLQDEAGTEDAPPPARKTLSFVKELRNVTRESGDFLRLRCEVTGSPPATDFRWLKHGVPIMEERNRVKLKTRLKDDPQWSQLRHGKKHK